MCAIAAIECVSSTVVPSVLKVLHVSASHTEEDVDVHLKGATKEQEISFSARPMAVGNDAVLVIAQNLQSVVPAYVLLTEVAGGAP